MLGKIEGKRRRGQQRMRWLDIITNSMDMNLSKLREIVEDIGTWCATVQVVTKSQTQLSKLASTKLEAGIVHKVALVVICHIKNHPKLSDLEQH